MRLSVKSRYALSAMICMSRCYSTKKCTTLISLSEKLNISKIYLEQVFSLLKRAGIVISTKGAQGGYLLVSAPTQISALNILAAIEMPLFEKTEKTLSSSNADIENALETLVFKPLDTAVEQALSGVSLAELTTLAEQCSGDSYMFYL